MFRYQIALPMAFTGQHPVIEVDHPDDKPLYSEVVVTLGQDEHINLGGGSMHLSAGSQVSGIVVGKQALPQGGNANP
ncbi:MAG TPA: hypothetical protein VFV87_10355 [Pirellulaceae bacterium]|nr:hypothetical protein [Pirellulaceae bacterium]